MNIAARAEDLYAAIVAGLRKNLIGGNVSWRVIRRY